MSDILKATSLCKIYGQKEPMVHALTDIHLTVSQDSFTAIVGRSGSGKTSLLNILGGLEAPTSGVVQFGNTDIYALSDSARAKFRRKHIGYVFQFFNLIPELTVYENICLPSYLDNADPDLPFLEEIMDKLGLTPKKEKYPAQLSGGEQQRVAVARALSRKPDIILADEPTGNLDRKTGEELMQVLLSSQRYFHQTILLVTHDLELAHTAERIITLDDGRICADLHGGQL